MTTIQTRSSGSSPTRSDRPRRERQTRLQEHLRTVKPGSRSSSPASKKPPAASSSASKTVPKALAASSSATAPAHDDEQSSTASGRPKRRAAARVVMREADSSSDEDDVDGDEGEDEQDDSEVERSSSSTRTPKKRSPLASDDDIAPSVRPAGRTTGRKMPAQEAPPASSPSPSKKRAREPRNLNVERLDEAEVQSRLAREKAELMARLAPLGIIPQDHVLDQALRAMSKSNTQLSVDSFIHTLASLDTNVSPVQRAAHPPLSVAIPPPAKKVTFSTLESPSTPTSTASPTLRYASPPHVAGPSTFAPTRPVAPPSNFYTSPPVHAGPPARPQLPAMRPGQHLGSLTRSFSAPSIPTLSNFAPAPLPTPALVGSASSNSLFGASVAGMGRVATRRGTFGSEPRQLQQSVAPSPSRSSFGSPAPPTPTAAAPANNLLPAFAFGAPAAQVEKPVHPTFNSRTTAPSGAPNRLSKLQSWLAQDDEGTSEDEDDKRPTAAAGAEAMLKAAAATSKVAAALPVPPMQLVDAPPSDDERDDVQIRVGGKSIQVLRQRRLDDGEGQQVADPQGMTTRASRRAAGKGKGRAVLECLCGAPAEGDRAAVACVECDVAFHLACLNAVSAKQLASPWTCSRCVVADEQAQHRSGAPEEQDGGRSTPQLVDKRVRIGTNSTPHVYQEPTFVASTPVSAPRDNNFALCADMALAPSPTASPVRRFASAVVPTSPPPNAGKLPIPVTPQFGEATVRAPGDDYSPTSPQNYRSRAGRTRMISGGAFLSGEWLNSWDGHAYGEEPPQPASTPVSNGLASLVDDEWHLPAWSDVTMTPSRALSSATPGTSSAASSVWDTPYAHASPHAHLRRSVSTYGPPTMHFRTASQDFLAALERDPAAGVHHPAPAQTFAQRLFGQEHPHPPPPAQAHHPHAPYDAQGLSAMRPPSPLNPRRMPPSHGHGAQHPHAYNQRKPSLGDGLANPWLGAVAHERMALSASMKPSLSAPGVGRFAQAPPPSAAAVEQQMLDDLLV